MRASTAWVLIPLLLAGLGACGGENADKPAGTVAPAAGGTPGPAPAGTPFDCKYFSLTVAAGWTASPESMGMVNVLPAGKTSPGLYFKFEGDGRAAGTAEAAIETMIGKYGGSPMESTTIAGTDFKTTTYTYGGAEQTMHVAFRNGTKVTITIEGPGGRKDDDIVAMLSSLTLK